MSFVERKIYEHPLQLKKSCGNIKIGVKYAISFKLEKFRR